MFRVNIGLELNAGNLDVGVQVYAGPGTVQSNYVNILWMLLHMAGLWSSHACQEVQ
jgi:hypothetical protein